MSLTYDWRHFKLGEMVPLSELVRDTFPRIDSVCIYDVFLPAGLVIYRVEG